jgi:hypothetical protein
MALAALEASGFRVEHPIRMEDLGHQAKRVGAPISFSRSIRVA